MTILDVEGETVVFSIESPIDESEMFFPMTEKVVDTVRWLESLEVPDLSGLTQEEAENRAGEDFNLESSYRPSSEPENRVVNQNPPPGEGVTQGSEISLTLSEGPEPGVTYETVSDDSGTLIEVGVDEGWTTTEIDQEGSKVGIIIETTDQAANVISSSEPIEAGVDEKRWAERYAERYAEEQSELLQNEFFAYHQLTFEATRVFGVPGYKRVFEWDPGDVGPVTQIQYYYAESGRGYVATATTLSDNFERYEPQLLDALNRITLIR